MKPGIIAAAAAEMNGKPLAGMLGALQALGEDGVKLAGEQRLCAIVRQRQCQRDGAAVLARPK